MAGTFMLPILLQIKKKWNSTIKELIPTQKLELFGGEAHTSYWGAPVIVMVQDLSSYQTWMENWSLILILANDYHKQPANIKDETCQNTLLFIFLHTFKEENAAHMTMQPLELKAAEKSSHTKVSATSSTCT